MRGLDNVPAAGPAAAIVGPVVAPFDAAIDEACGLLRVATTGVWTLAQAEDFLADLGALIDECRGRFGRARVLLDRRGNPMQPEAVSQRLSVEHRALFRDDDRLALVVDSSIAKSRLRHHLAHAGAQAFLSYPAAEKWLTAWS